MKTDIDPKMAIAAAQPTPNPHQAQRDRKALRKSCQDFEAIFVQSLFKAMRKTVPESELFTENTATELYRDMLDQEIATTISQRQSIGLAEQMYRQMEKTLPPEK